MFLRRILAALTAVFALSATTQAFSHVTALSPATGDSIHVGDTLHIRFTADSTVPSVTFQISFNNGFMYYDIDGKVFSAKAANWGDYPWVVPETLTTIDMTQQEVQFYTVASSVKILIVDQYNTISEMKQYPTGTFKILPRPVNSVEQFALAAPVSLTLMPNPAHGICRILGNTGWVSIFSPSGRLLTRQRIENGALDLDTRSLPAGTYVVNAAQGRRDLSKRLTIQK